jgi:hypothetical protein
MAVVIRGTESTDDGEMVRSAGNGRQGDHPTDPFGGAGVSSTTSRAAAAARGPAAELTRASASTDPRSSSLGHNAKVGRRIVEQACVERLHATRPGHVPANLVDFLNRATVHFLDADNHVIDIDAVMITWEE